MSSLPKCCSCIHQKDLQLICSVYPEGIPLDIATDVIECPEYQKKEPVRCDDDLPIAKGR